MNFSNGILTLAVIALASCRPLHGTNPLDGGTVSVTVVEPKPIEAGGDEASQMQDDRLKHLSTGGGYENGNTFRGSAGTSISSEF